MSPKLRFASTVVLVAASMVLLDSTESLLVPNVPNCVARHSCDGRSKRTRPSFSSYSTRRRRTSGPQWTGFPMTSSWAKSSAEEEEEEESQSRKLRYLGKGDRAVVRPGVVLVAPNHEYNHFLMRSAVFVHAIGTDEHGEHVTRGVIIDHPTAFTMGEMGGGSITGVLAQNTLFQGGDSGRGTAMLLHSCGGDSISCGSMIGTSGIYEGGVQASMEAADEGLVDPDRFKFFFNFVEFNDNELEAMLSGMDSDGDAWASVEVSPEIILNSDFGRGDAWMMLRNQISQTVGK